MGGRFGKADVSPILPPVRKGKKDFYRSSLLRPTNTQATMKTRNTCLSLVVALLVALLTTGIVSCNSKKEQQGPQPTEFEMGLTNQDSVAVRGLIDQFFTFVKAKDYAGATQMLYRTSPDDPKAEPQPLDNDGIRQVMQMLKSVPMEGYRIEYMKFNEANNNEVLCYVIIKKGNGKDMPDITTKMFFKPMSYLGQWSLGLMNSEWGDNGIVDPAKRDSMKGEYAKEQGAAKKK